MGKIDRLKRITLARIETFLDSLEKPEYILPQLIKEMGEQVSEAANAQAKALSAVKSARRRLDEAIGKVVRFGRGAELAVQANDTETARRALAAQIEAEQQAQQRQTQLDSAEKAYQSATVVCARLTADIKSLQKKKAILLKQYRRQELTKQLHHQYVQSAIGPSNSILDAVARIETKIQQQQIEVEVQTELQKTLGMSFGEERVRKLERDEQVDRRLDEIRKKLENGSHENKD